MREETLENKFKQLKISSKKTAEEMIEYKEKALQYTTMLSRTREVEFEMKGMSEKLINIEEQKNQIKADYEQSNTKHR
jgi:hypothetical protein